MFHEFSWTSLVASKKRSRSALSAPRRASVRYRTLLRLERALRLLTERYGARATLGEVLTLTAGLARLCRSDRVTIAEIAEATGLRKQNISRWAKKRVGQSILLHANEDDRRIKEVVLIDPDQGQDYVEALARILGTDGTTTDDRA